MSNSNLQKQLFANIESILYPLILSATDIDTRRRLLINLGWDFENIEGFPLSDYIATIQSIANSVENITDIINNPPEDLAGLESALLTVSSITGKNVTIDPLATK